MAIEAFEIPVRPRQAVKMSLPLGAATYHLQFVWNVVSSCWNLDILTAQDVPVITGIPLVTGADLLEQYGYLGIPGRLVVQSINDPAAVPTFDNFGTEGFIYYIVGDP